MNKELKKISKEIKKVDKIALFTHVSPDCDALGCVFGLKYALAEMGKTVDIYSKDKFTVAEKKLFDESLVKRTKCNPEEYDLFISCDVPALNRLGEYEDVFVAKKNNIVLDHHKNTGSIGLYNYIDCEMSSCCEIVFDLLKTMKCKITPLVASCLYAGLSSDTNSFINSNVTTKSFDAAKELLLIGADISRLNETLYGSRTKKEIEFKKYLWNNYKIIKDCAYCLVPYSALEELKGSKRDCDGYSHTLVSIEGINYSFSLVEQEIGFFNISMRSKMGYDVRKIAEKLGGGGHTCAAGARFYAKNIEDAKKRILSVMKEG